LPGLIGPDCKTRWFSGEINFIARKPETRTAEINPDLDKRVTKLDRHPSITAIFAGKLDDPEQSWLDRRMIRLIILHGTGGRTDGTGTMGYTELGERRRSCR
jgi:menaquinone-dependent protoporphyrinogen IX oxidase